MLFAAHESFHIREGWLRKGLLGVGKDPYVFSKEDAVDLLGVGKNMVSAIKYWLQATQLAEAQLERNNGKQTYSLKYTPFGNLVMRFDPYMEDEGTLWLLHYHLATNLKHGTTWTWFFNQFGVKHFTQDLFLTHLQGFVEVNARKKISPRSLEKDFRCFVRTYTRTIEKTHQLSPEESYDCPLSLLNLLEYLPKTKSYRTLSPEDGYIPDLVVAYALTQMRAGIPLMKGEISFRDALYAENSPGRIFNLDPELLFSYLTRLDECGGMIGFSQTAGLNLITLKTEKPEEILRRYYSLIGEQQ